LRRHEFLEAVKLFAMILGFEVIASARHSQQINQLPPALVSKVCEIGQGARGHIVDWACRPSLAGR
jgi:hypothetical protein